MEKEGTSHIDISFPPLSLHLVDRYLNVLDVPRRKPNIDGLREIVQAHLVKIPFENISKIYYKKHRGLLSLPSLELFLDGVEKFHFGGTCYANNYYLYQLLANLGYQIKLCGADMNNPDVHLVSMVTIENREFLIDVGYAAPFLFPLPRYLTKDFTIIQGRNQYVLKPQDKRGFSCMELYEDGNLKHGYLAKPFPRQINEFENVIIDSYKDDATFMKSILVARFFPHQSIIIHNMNLIESHGSVSSIRQLVTTNELAQVILDKFRIAEKFTKDVLIEMGSFEDAWS